MSCRTYCPCSSLIPSSIGLLILSRLSAIMALLMRELWIQAAKFWSRLPRDNLILSFSVSLAERGEWSCYWFVVYQYRPLLIREHHLLLFLTHSPARIHSAPSQLSSLIWFCISPSVILECETPSRQRIRPCLCPTSRANLFSRTRRTRCQGRR